MRVYAASALCFALIAAPGVSAQSVSKDPSHAPSGAYQLDPAHSQILFSVLHIGLTDYYGRFDRVSGTLNFDSAQPERSSVAVTIDTSSVDTPSQRLAEDLRGSNVFDIAQFANASFKSTSVARTGPSTGRISGELTIRNVTRPVTLDVVFNGGEQDPLKGNYAVGFRATATIKRSDFGMTGMIWSSFVSDDVQLVIEALFQHEKG